jgi:hypothetical protein
MPSARSTTDKLTTPAGVLAGVHRYGALRQPGPVGQRQQPVPQFLTWECGHVVDQCDHLSQYRTSAPDDLFGTHMSKYGRGLTVVIAQLV